MTKMQGVNSVKLKCVVTERTRIVSRGTQLVQKSTSDFRVLGFRKVHDASSMLKTPQLLGATVRNLVTRAPWRLGFVHP